MCVHVEETMVEKGLLVVFYGGFLGALNEPVVDCVKREEFVSEQLVNLKGILVSVNKVLSHLDKNLDQQMMWTPILPGDLSPELYLTLGSVL